VMGILNLTPHSFHPGSSILAKKMAIETAGRMLAAGAQIVDSGDASSRPGAEVISVEAELSRLMASLEAIRQAFPLAILSVDTWRAEVARVALEAGAHMINDITAGTVEPDILDAVAGANAPYIIMHMLGTPGNMPPSPEYEDFPGELLRFLVGKIRDVKAVGINDLIIDPGFGFGKSVT